MAAAVASVADPFGGLDGLVLNAGVMRPGGIAELPAADWDALVAVNLTGAFHTARAALPHLLAARGAVAAVVAWLLSDPASYVNGAVIPVDGADGAVDVGTLPFDPGSRSGVRTARSRPCSAAGAGRAPSARRCPCPWDG